MNWKLRNAITTKYHSQVRFSKVSGMPENALSYLINEHREPTERELLTIEGFLGVSREELFGEKILLNKEGCGD